MNSDNYIGDDGVEVHGSRVPGQHAWTIDWIRWTGVVGDTVGALTGHPFYLRTTNPIRPHELGLPDRSYVSVAEAYEYAAPLFIAAMR